METKNILLIMGGVLLVGILIFSFGNNKQVEDDMTGGHENGGEMGVATPPENCVSWHDGCNTCSVGEPGAPMACTRMFCETPGEPYCLQYADGSSDANPNGMHPSWDADGDGINDCEAEGICDHTIDYSQPRETTVTVSKAVETGLENNTYRIETEEVTLVDGKASEEAAPGSATQIVTQTTDFMAEGDLQQGTGATLDGAVILTQNPGGSGTFYYVGGTLVQSDNSYAAIDGTYFLGDRITVKEIKIDERMMYVTYLERNEGEAMTVAPSVETTKQYAVKGNALVEVTPAN